MEHDCTACGKPIRFDAAISDNGRRGVELHDDRLMLKSERVGTAYATGETYCSPCDEEN